MSSAILKGISNHSIPGIIVALMDLEIETENSSSGGEPEITIKEWQDLILLPEGGNIQTIISSKVDEYLAEIARQDAIWTAAEGMFSFTNPITMQQEERYIAKNDYIKPLGYSFDTIRVERNKRLADSDWTQLSDAPLTNEEKSLYATYRQALRDIPETYAADITQLVWPELGEPSSSS